MNGKQVGWLALSLTGVVLLPTGALAQRTQTYGVANFGGAGQCGSSGMTHSVHTQTAAAFANYFNSLKNAGQWTGVSSLTNTNVRADLWTDRTKDNSANAQDTQTNAGADSADVLFIHTHGGHNLADNHSWLAMGSNADYCDAVTDWHMTFGNTTTVGTGQLDIAVVKACQSGDYEVWKKGGYRTLINNNPNSTFTMWNAFHGDSSCGGFVKDYVKDYASSSKNNGVGENWIDEAYDWGLFEDDCPVSIVFGANKTVRRDMYENGGWRDRKNTGAKTGSSYFYVRGCNPDNGSKLPDP